MLKNLGQAGDCSYLRVEVSAVWKLLHHDGAGMVQQGLLMNRVLHLRDFLQVIQLKAFRLEMHVYTASQNAGRKQLHGIKNQLPLVQD